MSPQPTLYYVILDICLFRQCDKVAERVERCRYEADADFATGVY